MSTDESTEILTAEADSDEQDSLEQAIRRRAYEISVSPDAGTPEENWAQAEREVGKRD